MLIEASKLSPEIVVLNLSRNFGHQAAISAGLNAATGDCVLVMDADLQDPPELLPELVATWRKGYQVVVAQRKTRAERGLRRFAFDAFYRVFGFLADYPIPLNAGVFGLMDRTVVDHLLLLDERNRFLPGLRSWLGFRQTIVWYDRQERAAGEAKQTYWKLLKYGLDALFSFSYKPLRLSWLFGIPISLFSFVYGLILVTLRIFDINVVPGFTTPTVLLLFFGGIQLISIGILGEYMGRIYDEVKRRPLFIVGQRYQHGARMTHGSPINAELHPYLPEKLVKLEGVNHRAVEYAEGFYAHNLTSRGM
jgi:dolichol-phosphate mannosyltransferase